MNWMIGPMKKAHKQIGPIIVEMQEDGLVEDRGLEVETEIINLSPLANLEFHKGKSGEGNNSSVRS